ncbi:MAG: ACT domain-containing protein [Trueperaceae bacterium]|nr:ACT domain-containing protein [Trueperaceae bacterium]
MSDDRVSDSVSGDVRGGETDLARLLATLAPTLDAETYVFCTVSESAWAGLQAGVSPIATFREDEGVSLVLSRDDAVGAGLAFRGTFRRITLRVYSSLHAVGLLAAVTAALANAGISANAVAAFYHDHLFVPSGRADEAIGVLDALSDGR